MERLKADYLLTLLDKLVYKRDTDGSYTHEMLLTDSERELVKKELFNLLELNKD